MEGSERMRMRLGLGISMSSLWGEGFKKGILVGGVY